MGHCYSTADYDKLSRDTDSTLPKPSLNKSIDYDNLLTSTLTDFKIIKYLNIGKKSTTYLIKNNNSKKIFVLKTFNKENIVSKSYQLDINNQIEIYQHLNMPFIIKINYIFHSLEKIYLVLDYIPGGEFRYYLNKKQPLSIDQIKFYGSQLVLILEHIHAMNILYRDLHPSNILIDSNGYLKVTDFGISCNANIDKTEPCDKEYFSPEFILNKGICKASDWWCLGILLYKMATGKTPFFDKHNNKIIDNILKKKLTNNDNIDPQLFDLIKKLLIKDKKKRLGFGMNEIDEIKNHPFFDGLNWKAICNLEMKAPFQPTSEDMSTYKYFNKKYIVI